MSNSIAPGSSADVNVKVTALTTNPNVPVTYKTIILKKNLVNGINTLTQEMISATNTKYVIKYDYVLGEDVTVPANCILEFDGGSISAGTGENKDTITGANTGISSGLVKIFNIDVTLAGNWNIVKAYPEWFGAKGDGVTDDLIPIQKTIDLFDIVYFGNIYNISSPINLRGGNRVKVNGSIIYNGLSYAIIISSTNGVTIEGNGSITNNGSGGCIKVSESNYINIDGIGLINTSGSNIIHLYSDSAGVTRQYYSNIILYGGSGSSYSAVGILFDCQDTGYINENHFDKIRFHKCSIAIKFVNTSSHPCNRNNFVFVDAEGCPVHLFTQGGVEGNKFGLRSQEFTNGCIDVDGSFTRNIFELNNDIIKNAIINSRGSNPSFVSGSTLLLSNKIIGSIKDTQPRLINPYFYINGNKVVYGIRNRKAESSALSGNITLDVDKMCDCINIAGDSVIDIDYNDDALTQNIDIIRVTVTSSLSIVCGTGEGATTLYSQNTLYPGIYKVIYAVNRKSIQLYKIASTIVDTGTTTNRPTSCPNGFQYFDTTLGMPIYWNGTKWVKADGTDA